MEPGDNIKDSDKDGRSPRQSSSCGGLSSSRRSKKNISKNANTSGDRSANNTADNNVKIEEEASVATSSI